MFFMDKQGIPNELLQDATYGRVVKNYKPEKNDPNRTWLAVGGDRVNYPGDCGTPTVNLLTTKLLFSSIDSTLCAKFMTIYIK